MTAGVLAPFTDDLGEYVCAGLREGKTLIMIANELSITRQTIYKWKRLHPLFESAYISARAEGAHTLIDESIAIADDETIEPHRARNMITARQWAAERRNRKDYGQAIDMTLTERVDLGGTLIEARKRTVLPGCDLAPALPVQDAEYTMIAPSVTTDSESVASSPAVNPFD